MPDYSAIRNEKKKHNNKNNNNPSFANDFLHLNTYFKKWTAILTKNDYERGTTSVKMFAFKKQKLQQYGTGSRHQRSRARKNYANHCTPSFPSESPRLTSTQYI